MIWASCWTLEEISLMFLKCYFYYLHFGQVLLKYSSSYANKFTRQKRYFSLLTFSFWPSKCLWKSQMPCKFSFALLDQIGCSFALASFVYFKHRIISKHLSDGLTLLHQQGQRNTDAVLSLWHQISVLFPLTETLASVKVLSVLKLLFPAKHTKICQRDVTMCSIYPRCMKLLRSDCKGCCRWCTTYQLCWNCKQDERTWAAGW